MTPEDFRTHGRELIDWIADYRRRLEGGEFPATAQVRPGWLRQRLPAVPPTTAEPFDSIRADVDRLIVPALGHIQHPMYYGYFPTGGSLSSVLGDYVSTGLAQLGLNWASSPALTELEEHTLDWFRQMLGLSSEWHGVIHDTASTGTLVALLCARERATSYGAARGGLQAESAPLVVYVSTQSHSSVDKAALLAGFGRDNVRRIDTDDDHAMELARLEHAIAEDLAAGRKPCAVVATTGTTGTTALDTVRGIAALAQRFGLWLHVDAALAGSAMILPQCRWVWDGIEGGDS